MTKRCALEWVKEVAEGSEDLHTVSRLGEALVDFPLAIIYPGPSQYRNSDLGRPLGEGIHTIFVDLHFPLEGVAENWDQAIDSESEFIRQLKLAVFDNRVQRIVAIDSTFSELDGINGIETYGPGLTIQVSSED